MLSRSYPLWSRVADISDTVPVAIRLIKVGHQRAVIPDVWNTITIGVRELVHVNQPGGFDSIYIAVSLADEDECIGGRHALPVMTALRVWRLQE